MRDLPSWTKAIVEEVDIEADAHAQVGHCDHAAFSSAHRAVCYARHSAADTVIVYDREGNIIFPEEASL
mgnify:CR=1 FL=1